MGEQQKNSAPIIQLNVFGTKIHCLIDSGSSVTLIKDTVAQKLIENQNLSVKCSNKILKSISGKYVEISGCVCLDFQLGKKC